MARPLIPLDIVRVVVEGTVNSFPWVNTFWLKAPSSATPTGTQVSALAQAFHGAYNTRLMSGRSDHCSLLQTIAEWNDGAGGVVDGAFATPHVGTFTGEAVPMSVAMVISWRVAVRYRGGHPRSYLAGLADAARQDEVSWNSTNVSAFSSQAANFLDDINALSPAPFTSVSLGVLRQFANGGSEAKPPVFLNPPVFRPFTSALAKPGLGSQRRRFGHNLN